MSTFVQRSFAGGEISPALYARVDVAKYASGLRTLRNFYVMRHGGATNRPGWEYICEVKDSTKIVRLVKFIFNSEQTYVLEFGDLYMRVIKSGVAQTDLTLTITGISNAAAGVVSYTGTDPVNGQEVFIESVVGPIGTYVNNRNFKIANVDGGANTFELQDMSGTNFNTTSLGAYTSGGTAKRIYELTTPYTEDEIYELQYVQSADVITIAHPNHRPRELARLGDTNWTLIESSFDPDIASPDGGAGTAGGAGANSYRYRVTSIASETLEESLPGFDVPRVITGVTQAAVGVVTYTGTDPANGDEIYIDSVVGMTELNGNRYLVANVNTGANTFELQDENGANVNTTAYTAYSSGGTWARTFIAVYSAAAPTTGAPHVLTWTAVAAAQEYNVYKEDNGVYGFIGVAGTNTFRDTNFEADTTDTPPLERDPFVGAGNYPSVVTYFQQRLGFASPDNDVEKCFFSRSAQYRNFTVSSPIQDDDAVTFTMAGKQVNKVKHMIDLGKLIVLTSGGEWSVEGDASGILKPGEINPKQYSYNGSSDLPPIIIGGNALYLQARGSIIRDLSFDFEIEGYRGNDLTIFSAHMFDGYQMIDWDYQQIPHSVVWVVRDDGVLLGLTYVREHQLWAWHRHDTDGLVEAVCVVPEGNEDVLYLTVAREIDGVQKRYIERMSSRFISDVRDASIMDSFLSYDGRHGGVTTMTLSEYSGGGWLYTSTVTITASAGTFAATDVGNEIQLYDIDGEVIRFELTEYVSSTVMRGRPNRTVPVSLRTVAAYSWVRAVDELSGLWHIEGKQVSVFADGFVVANPNNPAYNVVTVTNGQITLDRCYGVIHIGLPITSDIQTLDVDTTNGETVVDKMKLINKVTMYVEGSRGIWVGTEPPSDDDTDMLEGLTEVKVRTNESYDAPVEIQTGTVECNVRSTWNNNGRVFIRQTDPVPLSILAVAPAGLVPFTKAVN
jgi:hypothetical protein